MKKNGFTLIELLVSISIIAILTVLASVSFTKVQKNGRDQRRIDDLKSIQNAAEQYFLLTGVYLTGQGNYSGGAIWKNNDQIVLQKYPIDPKNDSANGYIYTAKNISTFSYCICAKMEVIDNSNAEDTDCTFVNKGYFCVKNQQ